MTTKFHNVPTAVDGVIFQSKKEAGRFVELRMLQRSGIISNLELQKRFDFKVNGVNLGYYLADFAYTSSDGREVVEDVKSEPTKTPIYRLKAKLMLAIHNIRVVEV